MLSKIFFLAGLSASIVLAEPIPQAAATTEDTSFPTDPAAISAELASASSLESLFAGMPTLPLSIESVLETAIPSASLTATDYACALVTGTPDWYKSLPADVKTALTSYESAVESWYQAHSSQLPSVSTTAVGSAARCTALASVKSSGSAGSTATGTSATASGTASGTAAGTSASKAGGARPTGAIAASFAGAVGVLGLMVAL